MKQFSFRKHFFLISYLIALLSGIVLLFHYHKADIHLWVNQNNYPALDVFFKYFTHVGDGLFMIGLSIFFLFVTIRKGLIIFIAFLASGILVQVLKKLIFSGMVRPKTFFDGIYDLYFVDGVNLAGYQTFPSGHTATAFAMFFCLACFSGSIKFKGLFLILALLVGYSRMYLSQHFLPDVIAGSVIGILCGIFSIYLMDKFSKDWLNSPLQKLLASRND